MPKEKLPDGVNVHCHNKGWMDHEAVWPEKVWLPRPVSFFNRTLLLICDTLMRKFGTLSKMNRKQPLQ